MNELLSALKASDTLSGVGTVTEYLPVYSEMTYTFNAGLSARIADHGNGKYQMTLGGVYNMEPGTPDQIVAYLESL